MSLRRLVKNSAYLLGMNLSSLGALFLFAVLLARMVGKDALGLYALFAALIMPFSFLIDLGQSTSLVQEIGRSPGSTRRILWNSIALKLVLTFVATALLTPVSFLYFQDAGQRHLFWIFALLLLPRAVSTTFEVAFRAHQRMAPLMWIGVVAAALLVIGSSVLLFLGAGLAAMFAFFVVVEVVRALLGWVVFRRTLSMPAVAADRGFDSGLVRLLVRRSLPFFAMGLVGMLYYRVDVLLLAAMRDTAEVGTFTAASSFVKLLRVAPSVIVAAFFPAISAWSQNSPLVRHLSAKTLRLQLVSSLLLAGTFFLLARPLILHTFGFAEAVAILRVFVWSLVPLSLYSTLVYVFFQADRWVWNIRILLGILALNVGLNLVLIPKLGAMALALSSLVSESACFLIYFGLFLRLIRAPVSAVPSSPVPGYEEAPSFGWRASAG